MRDVVDGRERGLHEDVAVLEEVRGQVKGVVVAALRREVAREEGRGVGHGYPASRVNH